MKLKDQKLLLIFYVLIHFAAFAAFGISAACKRFSITSDLFSMIPNTAASEALKTADQKLTGSSGKSVFILSRSDDFSTAKKMQNLPTRLLRLPRNFLIILKAFLYILTAQLIQRFLIFCRPTAGTFLMTQLWRH